MNNLTFKSFALAYLTMERLEGFKESKSEHPLYGELKRSEFMMMMFLALRVHRASSEQVRHFVAADDLKKLAGFGYIILSKNGLAIFYELSQKGREVIEKLVNRFLANVTEVDKHINLVNFDK